MERLRRPFRAFAVNVLLWQRLCTALCHVTLESVANISNLLSPLHICGSMWVGSQLHWFHVSRLKLHDTLRTLNDNNLMLFAEFVQVLQPDAIKDDAVSPSAFSMSDRDSASQLGLACTPLPLVVRPNLKLSASRNSRGPKPELHMSHMHRGDLKDCVVCIWLPRLAVSGGTDTVVPRGSWCRFSRHTGFRFPCPLPKLPLSPPPPPPHTSSCSCSGSSSNNTSSNNNSNSSSKNSISVSSSSSCSRANKRRRNNSDLSNNSNAAADIAVAAAPCLANNVLSKQQQVLKPWRSASPFLSPPPPRLRYIWHEET